MSIRGNHLGFYILLHFCGPKIKNRFFSSKLRPPQAEKGCFRPEVALGWDFFGIGKGVGKGPGGPRSGLARNSGLRAGPGLDF